MDAVSDQNVNSGTDIPYADYSHSTDTINDPVSTIGVGLHNASVAVYNGEVGLLIQFQTDLNNYWMNDAVLYRLILYL